MQSLTLESDELVNILTDGGVGVLPTDTLYGLVGSALKPKVVERIYKLRKRNKDKPMIVLISKLEDVKKFGIRLDTETEAVLDELWPGKVSVILPCRNPKFRYLHRGANTIAFRVPQKDELIRLLSKVGPLVAPSANVEGEKPSKTVDEAKQYFGDSVDFYVDEEELDSAPSTLVSFEEGKLKVIREGAYKL